MTAAQVLLIVAFMCSGGCKLTVMTDRSILVQSGQARTNAYFRCLERGEGRVCIRFAAAAPPTLPFRKKGGK